MAVGVFISYNHADIRIANVLKECLLALSGDISVFIDHAGLVSGDEYEPTLARNIAASQWFLMVCSGPPRPERDMGWCLVEAGQFRGKLLNESRESLIRSRLIAIHDDARPRQLSSFESVKISAFDRSNRLLDLREGSEDTGGFESTDAFKLFANILTHSTEQPLRNLSDDDVRSMVRKQARQLIRIFAEAGGGLPLPEVVLQHRISFKLPPLTEGNAGILTEDIAVTGYDAVLQDIFAISGNETTWGSIKQRIKEQDGSDPLWASDIENAAMQVARDFLPEQPEGLCLSAREGKLYRVLFARYQPYRNGARTCYVLFIPSRPRQFDVKRRSSILLSALILSIRFRQRVLPFIESIRTAPATKKAESLLTMERILHQVETEALELGLTVSDADEDEPPLLQVVRPGEGKTFMEESIKSWIAGRNAMAQAISAIRRAGTDALRAEAIKDAEGIATGELEKVRSVNGRFIELLTEELLFNEKVGIDAQSVGAPRAPVLS